MSKTNPNGANGTTSDPREQIMWDIYISKLTKGIENAKQSAIEAGYSEEHSDNITLQGWFKGRKDKLKRKEILSKAEKILDKTLSYTTEDAEGKVKTDLLRIQTDVAKHVTSTLGKDQGYSNRTEMTGPDGDKLELGVVILPQRNENTLETSTETGNSSS